MDFRKTISRFPVILAIGFCVGLGLYTYKNVSQVGKNLTDEYHEAFRHSSSLLRDTLKFQFALADYVHNCDEKSYAHLIQTLDLMFLRLDVVNNLAARLVPTDHAAITSLVVTLEKIETDIHEEASLGKCTNMDKSREEISRLFEDLKAISNRLELVSQHKITESAKIIDDQAIKSGVTLSITMIISVIAILLFFRQRKVAAEILRLRNLLSIIINSMPASLVGVDVDCNITQWNTSTEKQTGHQEKDVKGRPLSEVLPDMVADLPIIQESIEMETVKRETGRSFQTADGIKYKDITIFPLKAESVKGAVIITDDVTEKHIMQEKLNRRSKMEAIGTLAGGVAHDLNNTLSGIVSYPELLLLNLPEDSPYRKPILTIQKSGKKAAAMVDDLLSLARRVVPATSITNLNTLISAYLLSPECDSLKSFYPNVSFEIDLDPNLKNIVGSPVHMTKIIMNLVSNGAESLLSEGLICIQTENCYLDEPIGGYNNIIKGEYAKLLVSDTGIGIPAENLNQIFEPFFTKKEMGRSGTGLGLAVVWGAVQDHQGYIDVHSDEGKGTTFTVYFPTTTESTSKSETSQPLIELFGNREKILVIDDSKSQREIASEMLSKLNYQVYSVASGEKAIEYLKKYTADLLVLDMILEHGIDGLETYQQVLKFKPHQKAIITSGYAETTRVKKAQDVGAANYLKKPYTLVDLGFSVKTELARSTK